MCNYQDTIIVDFNNLRATDFRDSNYCILEILYLDTIVHLLTHQTFVYINCKDVK